MNKPIRQFKEQHYALNKRVCIDDFGTSVYRCRYTNRIVYADSCRLVGPYIKSVQGVYVCDINSKEEERLDRGLFDEMERNCNSCKNLVRIPHKKSIDGFLEGKCPTKGFYHLRFHPEDPMHMECWQSRVYDKPMIFIKNLK